MKKLLIILTVLLLNLGITMAGVSITIDGKPVALTPIKRIFEDNTIEKLQDNEITFQSANYDIRDAIVIGLEEDPDKGYKLNVGYYYIFDENIDMTKASKTDPLEVKFLGETLKIVGIISGNELTIAEGTEYFSESGQLIGKLEFPNYKNGDSFKEDPDWNWDLNGLNTKSVTTLTLNTLSGPYIGVKNNPAWSSVDSEECITLPNNFLTICIKPCQEDCLECETNDDSQWCSMKLCSKDDDCYITTATTPQTFIDGETYDCCNNTLDAFNKGENEFGGKSFKYYFRDYCPKQKLECKEPIDLSSYKAVCKKNVCKAIKLTNNIKEKTIEKDIYKFLEEVVENGNYILILGDKAPSSDSLAATDIASGIQRYSSGETILEAKLASEVTDKNKMILLGHPCDNPLINLSCKNWPYKQGETLIKVDGDNLIIAGTTAEDTRSTAKIVANYKDYPFFKESNIVLVTSSGLKTPEIIPGSREKTEEVKEEEIVEEKTGEETVSKSPELTEEEPAIAAEKLVEEKGLFKRVIGGFGNLLKKVWCKVLHPFGNERYASCLEG